MKLQNKYHIDQGITFPAYLNDIKRLIIPIEQRGFQWSIEMSNDVFNDIIKSWNECYVTKDKEENYVHLGMFMTFRPHGSIPSLLYDAQQRTFTLSMIYKIFTNHLHEILEKIKEDDQYHFHQKVRLQSFYDNFLDMFFVAKKHYTEDECKEYDDDIKRRPKLISYISENDNMCTETILNNKHYCVEMIKKEYKNGNQGTKTHTHYYYDDKEHQSMKKLKKYLEDKNNDSIYNVIDSNLFKNYLSLAYEFRIFFTNNFHTDNLDIDKLLNFCDFMDNNIFIDHKTCYDLKYAQDCFQKLNWKNGLQISFDTVVKNIILSFIESDNNKKDFIEKLDTTVDRINKVKDNFGVRLDFKRAIIIMLMKQAKFKNVSDIGKDIYNECEKLFSNHGMTHKQFISEINSIVDCIENLSKNKYIRNMIYSKRLLTFEGWAYLIIPFYFLYKNNINDLIRILVSFEINVMCLRTKTFNSFEYCIPFRKIISDNNNYISVINALKEFFSERLNEQIIGCNKEKYINTFENFYSLPVYKKKAFLLYYEYSKNTNLCDYNDISKIDLEHIIPQSTIEDDKYKYDFQKIHSLGNLTLYEAINTFDSEHKGNRSLQDKCYNDKRIYYKRSHISITTTLGEEKDTFSYENDIKIRENEIASYMYEKNKF